MVVMLRLRKHQMIKFTWSLTQQMLKFTASKITYLSKKLLI